jgi:riboflavin biosynthesis pyrimidine reductase
VSEAPPLDVLWPAARAGQALAPDGAERELAELYRYPDPPRPWVRANMVATLDGAAYGHDGRTGSINTRADFRVFVLLRSLADVVLAGAGTVRAERYDVPRVRSALATRRASDAQAPAPVLAVVTRSGLVPEDQGLFDGGRRALVVTCEAAGRDRLSRVRDLAGSEGVLVSGEQDVDLSMTLGWLAERGLARVLCEGGPELLTALTAAGLLDELCLTWSPTVVGGDAGRIAGGTPLDVPLRLEHLLHGEGSLIGRWTVERR